MKCLGCYIEVKAGYCLKCRKKLFNKEKVSTKLSFDAPKSDNHNFFQDNTKKISISGVQLKYSLQLKNGQLELCEKEGAYILKPIPEARQLIELNAAPENEHVTMQIAEQIFGLKVAANALIYFKDGEPAYITKRFDVKENGTKYLQEDFAQLTQRTTHTHGETYKYEGSYAEIGTLIRQYVAAAIPALESFFKLIVFNYFISNGDAHLKNFSLFRTIENEYQLTPAYDLMSTVIHTPHESDVALSLYDNDLESDFYAKYGFYGSSNFLELANRLGIIENRAKRIIQFMLNKKTEVESLVNNSFLDESIKEKYVLNFQDKIKRMEIK